MQWRLFTAVASLGAACLISAIIASAYIRLSPPRIDHAHEQPHSRGAGDYRFPAGHEAIRRLDDTSPDWLTLAEAIILATPRTRSLDRPTWDNVRLYETRSLVWGFPDYTSVWIEPGAPPLLVIRSTARFGNNDFGMNRARIQLWFETLGLPPVLP